MGRFIFTTSADNEAYCLEIAQAMTFFFGITQEEAVSRINNQWGEVDFGDSDLLYHEPPDYWAKWIFLGENHWRGSDSATSASLSRMERKLNRILDHLGLDYAVINDHILALLRQGKKLRAMDLYHKETGVPLQKAKEVIDHLAVSLAEAGQE